MIILDQITIIQRMSIYKQTENRNERDSNISLGTRLTVLSKRLGRKRCCDATPDRCLGGVSSHYLRIVKKCVVFFQKSRGFGWIPGPEAYQMKK